MQLILFEVHVDKSSNPCTISCATLLLSSLRFVCPSSPRWQLMEAAAGKLPAGRRPIFQAGRGDVVQWTMATAAANSLTVIRAFAHGVSPAFPLQRRPGPTLLLLMGRGGRAWSRYRGYAQPWADFRRGPLPITARESFFPRSVWCSSVFELRV